LAGAPGIIAVSASELTGKLLILFETRLSLDEVIAVIERVTPTVLAACTPAACLHTPQPKPLRRSPALTLVPTRTGTAPRPVQVWHTMETGEVENLLGTSRHSGLTAVIAEQRLRRDGPNRIPRARPRGALSVFLAQFGTLPVLLLSASAVVSVLTGGLADAAVIMAVVLINAGVGYVTEIQAERTIHALAEPARALATVLRGGELQAISPEALVQGDILLLAPGQFVPADLRLLETRNLSIDESALTGESHPVGKSTLPLRRGDITLGDRINMAYTGTVVTGGNGLGVVVATGPVTEMGVIQGLIGETRPPPTPIQKQLDAMGRQMVWLSGAVCVVVFGVGVLRGYGFLQMLRAAVSLAVAAVPEGLPTVATTTLALGIRNMRRHRVLIRQLHAVETLGSVQVICLDKTGTLTMNRMSVLALYCGGERLSAVNGRLFGPRGESDPYGNDGLLRLLHTGALCNETQVDEGRGTYVLNGSATEVALVQLAIDRGTSITDLRRRYPLVHTDYRTEDHKYMRTVHRARADKLLVAVKGSPEEVLDLCRWQLRHNQLQALTEQDRLTILAENDRMAGEALRVLGIAFGEINDGSEPASAELVWLGLMGLADPIRHGVKDLIALFHQAGIRTVMITGDQSATAYAIGKELGLNSAGQLEILDSSHLEKVDPQVLSALTQTASIFARVSPANKLQIVQGMQRAGRVVAMTGDGINDGPALKAADIGVAMGRGGAEVARAVADVVLEDDNLQTMIVAVSQGRTIYSNIRKSVHFLMSTNLSEIGVMLAAVGAGMGQPLNTMQLLWINLVTDIFPALALSVEPPEPDVLRLPPRDPEERILAPSHLKRYAAESLVITAGTMASYGYGVLRYGIGPRAGTLAFTTLTLAQLLHSYSCRSETHGLFGGEKLPPNHYLNSAVGASVLLQAASLVVPGLRQLLGNTILTPADAMAALAGAGAPLLINEAVKGVAARRVCHLQTRSGKA
jgi:Ca2+-transporting ATPase